MSSVRHKRLTSELSALMRRRDGCDSAQQIVNVAATAEAFAVTFLGVALESATGGGLALDADQQRSLRASRAEEQAHYKFLRGAGAKPLTKAFKLPNAKVVTDVSMFWKTLITLEELSIATYIAAAQEFAILGHWKLAELTLAIGAVEAAHRVQARLFAVESGVITGLPNDVAFQQAKFDSARKALNALHTMGFIGGGGQPISYPGPGSFDRTDIKHLTP